MALIKCRECNQDVSDSFTVTKCPHCGAHTPDPEKYKRAAIGAKVFGGVIAVLVLLIVLSPAEDPQAKAQRLNECRQDLHCWAQEHRISMMIACNSIIEDHAKYQFKWGDGEKYEYINWHDKENGIIAYKGDNIRFQNGFGTFQRMNYGCYWDGLNQQLVDVVVEPIE